MNNIDKIVQILEESSDDIRTDGHHEYSGIYSENYKDIAETIVENLIIPVVGWQSEQLPEFDVKEINDILKDCKENKDDLLTLISRIWNKGYMTAVCDEREG